MNIEDKKFDHMVKQAWTKIPDEFIDEMENLAIVIETRATPEQLSRLKVKGLLLGLFEGLPKTAWGQASNGIPPGKITIFQEPILEVSEDMEELEKNIRIVLMHEVAHYFGYSDDDMFIMDAKLRRRLANKPSENSNS